MKIIKYLNETKYKLRFFINLTDKRKTSLNANSVKKHKDTA